MKTTIHYYYFDTNIPEQAEAYKVLAAELLTTPGRGHCMNAAGDYGGGGDKCELNGATIELETTFLFDNQWNTAPIPGISEKGLRVFDWAETARSADYNRMRAPGRDWAPLNIRRGHYLDITDEMRAIRRDTLKCGYCGAQHSINGAGTFCDRCLDSAYLKPEDLKLLRLRPVDAPFNERRPDLTEEEHAELFPRYIKAQAHGSTERGIKRIAADRARLLAEYEKTTTDAKVKLTGFLWLMDRGINTENVIYYPHTGKFSFGWRKPLSAELVQALPLAEFPFPYQIEKESA